MSIKRKNAFRSILTGAVLIALQILLVFYYKGHDLWYVPRLGGKSVGYIICGVLYYAGYFMIGIAGIAAVISGIKSAAGGKEGIGQKDGLTSVLYPVMMGLFIAALWQSGVLLKLMNTTEVFLPKPKRIWTVFYETLPTIDWQTAGQFTYNPDLADHVISSLKIIIIGLLSGSILGYGVAVIATVFEKWGKGGLTVVSVFNAIPIVALAPVMIYWTKVVGIPSENGIRSMISKALVVMLVCTATMSVTAYRGLTELKPFSEDLLLTYACKKSEIFFKLRVPNSIPYIFTALKVSLPLSVISTLVSEYFGDADVALGVGRMIKENITNSQFAVAWVYIAVACVMGITLYALLMILQSILLRKRKAR